MAAPLLRALGALAAALGPCLTACAQPQPVVVALCPWVGCEGDPRPARAARALSAIMVRRGLLAGEDGPGDPALAGALPGEGR